MGGTGRGIRLCQDLECKYSYPIQDLGEEKKALNVAPMAWSAQPDGGWDHRWTNPCRTGHYSHSPFLQKSGFAHGFLKSHYVM